MFEWEKRTKEFVNDDQIYQNLKRYVDLIIEKNKEFNLTGFNEETIWLDGIYQSIFILSKFIDYDKKECELLDIGSGAGFPSIPFYILSNNQINLTIYEPIKKRCNFLNLVKDELKLKNLNIINKRVEDEKDIKNKFDFVIARAVMPLKMLIEVSCKMAKIGGVYLFLKSIEAQNELNESKWILNELKIKDVEMCNLNLCDGKTHNIIKYSKQHEYSNFPRKWSEIIKK